jgi:putative FmdB family regulatory protein
MPIYEYRCSRCAHEFEVWQKMSDPPVKICPKCHAHKVEKLISVTSFQLKGTGWYATDYGRGKSSPSGKGSSGGGASEAGSSGSDGKASGGEKPSGEKPSGEKASAEKAGSGEKASAEKTGGGKAGGSKAGGSRADGGAKADGSHRLSAAAA